MAERAEAMTLGDVARHFGCKPWQVRALFERGKLPPAKRLGVYRFFTGEDLPALEAALREAGYLAGKTG
jgi:DNA-binding transcriptional MerR regulator